MEGGLIDHWKFVTWVRMKENARQEPRSVDLSRLPENDDVKPLVLDDMQSAFALCAVLSASAIISFLGEMLVFFTCKRAKKKDAFAKWAW